ncbi:hypothetical protein [Paraburkholderia fungorum]|uniref:hypothetical protein n=1 Tax=Paraburkholderia fungorum TaxID=134537 RepID=UPI0003F9DFEB|nr:hypothetical protein [Paraburkholderia fungorum]PZR48603.1 MAG: hypothetical protein DI523_10575 [Paraburkholderia fungorum]
MNPGRLRKLGLHSGYIIPSDHWGAIERTCGEEASERSALLVEVPEETRQAFEAANTQVQSKLTALRTGGGLYVLAIALQAGACQPRIVLNLSEPHVRQYLEEAAVSGELLLGLHAQDNGWVHSTVLAIEREKLARILAPSAGASPLPFEAAEEQKILVCFRLLHDLPYVVFGGKPAHKVNVVYVKDTSRLLFAGASVMDT